MGFQLVQILYWLALSTWFGGVMFIAVAAPVIFRTIRERKPVLPDVLSVNLDGQHGTLLAGTIVGNLLERLALIELVCAAVLLLMMIGQLFVIDLTGSNAKAAILRAVLFFLAAGLVAYDRWAVWPRIIETRQQYIDHADEPEVANPAREVFDREHHKSVQLLAGVLFALLGIILFSGAITPKRAAAPLVPPSLTSP